MAQIDPSIAMGFRPIQIESPVNQMMAAAQLQGAQQQQQMNALKMQEYQQQQREKNELAQAISGKDFDLNNPAHVQNLLRKAPTLGMPYVKEARMAAAEKAKADKEAVQAEREKFQMRKEQLDFTERALQNSTNPMLARAQIQQAMDLKYVTPEVGVQMLTSVPEDPTEFDAWRTNLIAQSMSAKEKLERTQPKPEKFELGGKIITIDMNPQSPTYNTQLREDAKTAAPAPITESNLARLQRERAVLVAADSNDPRIKQIDEAIGKETGTTMTAEQKSQAQDRAERRAIERQRLNLDRYKASKGDGSGRGPGPGTKLEKGEIWNEAEQRIETVPGSKLNIAQSNAHGKDRSSLVAVETKTNSAINKIDEILDPKNQSGFDANFSGMVPYGGFVTGRFAPDSRRKIESLKADMKSAGLELIRQGGSIGQITEREWPILEAMIAGISPEMTPEAARAEFTKVRAYMNRLKDNAKDAYQTEWGDTQYFKPSPGDKTPRAMSAPDKQALDWANSNPKDPRSAQIKQRLGVK